jgi:hypothetical protein
MAGIPSIPGWFHKLLVPGKDVPSGLPVSIAEGGTGQTTAITAFNALSPQSARGDLITRDATNDIRLAIGTNGQLISTDGTDPSWVPGLTARGDLLTRGASAYTRLGVGTANQVLLTNGTDPSWGTVAIAGGGTGQTTQTAAFNALSPQTNRGDLITRDASNDIRLGVGAAGRVLTSDGTDPSWQPPVRGLFLVDLNGTDETGLTPSAENKITFSHKVIDVDGWFDAATNHRYTPLVAGYYLFFSTVACLPYAAAADTGQAIVYKNGSAVYYGNYISATTTDTIAVAHAVVSMNGSTDYIEAYMYLPSTASTILGDVTSTFFYGYRLSP